jgi:hypothetical protein
MGFDRTEPALGLAMISQCLGQVILAALQVWRKIMVVNLTSPVITWELLPDDFVLPDDPVGNIDQPALAAALTESLELAGRLPQQTLVMTHYGICATLDGKVVVKAPDWGYMPAISVSRAVRRSYTP